jgi:hypothetical protein
MREAISETVVVHEKIADQLAVEVGKPLNFFITQHAKNAKQVCRPCAAWVNAFDGFAQNIGDIQRVTKELSALETKLHSVRVHT